MQKIVIESSTNKIIAKGYFDSSGYTEPTYIVLDCPEEFNSYLIDKLKYVNEEILAKTQQELDAEENAKKLAFDKLEIMNLLSRRNSYIQMIPMGMDVSAEIQTIDDRINELKTELGIP